jgi:hypothetical protein
MPKEIEDDQFKQKVTKKKNEIYDKLKKKKLFHGSQTIEKKEIENKKIIVKKAENSDFFKFSSNKLSKIKKQTQFLVKLDKYDVRDKIEALKAYFVESKEKEQGLSDTVRVTITLSKLLQQVTMRPIKIPLHHSIYPRGPDTLIALVVPDWFKPPEGWSDFTMSNRIKVDAL